MGRTNDVCEGTAKQFANGNINIKFSPDAIESIKSGHISDIEVIDWILENMDTDFIGEEFCLSNYEMGAMLYDCHNDLVFIISFSDIENILMTGHTLKLYAHEPDEDDRETINEYYND